MTFVAAITSIQRDCLNNFSGLPVPCLTGGPGWWGVLRSFLGVPVPGPAGAGRATDLLLAIVEIALAVVGLLSVLFLVIGGIRYITAHGNEEQAEAAKKTVTNSIIGLVIALLAFVVVSVIANALINKQV